MSNILNEKSKFSKKKSGSTPHSPPYIYTISFDSVLQTIGFIFIPSPCNNIKFSNFNVFSSSIVFKATKVYEVKALHQPTTSNPCDFCRHYCLWFVPLGRVLKGRVLKCRVLLSRVL